MKHSFKSQALTELNSVLKNYPKFVFSKNDIKYLDGIPVFVYHTIDPFLFEEHLKYLSRNNYKSLSIEEFYDVITLKKTIRNDKAIILTIDDARSSVWRFAYPLLKKYKMHATVFVIPGITQESDTVRNNLENIWNNENSLNDIIEIDVYDETLCNWNEIRQMYKSGFVNIESHTLFHREIFNEYEIIDFITDDVKYIPYNFKASPYYTTENIGNNVKIENYLGLPIFKSQPVMLGGRKINISKEFLQMCRNIYKNRNESNNWQNEIIAIINDTEYQKKYLMIENDSRKNVYDDLKIAKEIIQEKLDKNAGNHLCLPWTRGNNLTVEICKELEIKSIFWGILENKKINRPEDSPYQICRIKNDFIFRLPGKNRKSLFAIYFDKIKRRISGEKVF